MSDFSTAGLAFSHVSLETPCPICKSYSLCLLFERGLVCCSEGEPGRPTVETPKSYEYLGPDGEPGHELGNLYRLARAGRASLADAEKDYFKRSKTARAMAIWRAAEFSGDSTLSQAGEDHTRVRAYLQARGVPIDLLPASKVPKALRYHACCDADMIDEAQRDGNDTVVKAAKFLRWPAMVSAVANVGGTLTGVHRTFLSLSKAAKRTPDAEFWPSSKQMLGPCKSGAIRMGRDYPGRAVILSEGVETALACMAATGLTAWACLDARKMSVLELPDELFGHPGRPGGSKISTIIIAADLDRSLSYSRKLTAAVLQRQRETYSWVTQIARDLEAGGSRALPGAELLADELRTGQIYAMALMHQVLTQRPWLSVAIRWPSRFFVPELVKESDWGTDEAVNGKGVDWCDLFEQLPRERAIQATRAGLLNAVDLNANEEIARAWTPRKGMLFESVRATNAGLVGAQPSLSGSLCELESRSGLRGAGTSGGDSLVDEAGHELPEELTREMTWFEASSDKPCISPGPTERARLFLMQECWQRHLGKNSKSSTFEARFRLVRWANSWFSFNGRAWRQMNEVQLRGKVQNWLSKFVHVRELERGIKLKPVHPKVADVSEVMAVLAHETHVGSGSMPCWLPSTIDRHNRPVWGESLRSWESEQELDDDERGAASNFAVYSNGRLDLGELEKGRVVVHEPSPSLFTHAVRPYAMAFQDLERVIKDGWKQSDWAKYCPAMGRFVNAITDGNEARINQLGMMFGDSCGARRTLEFINLCPGFKRGGKGTTMVALGAATGSPAVGTSSIFDISDRFGLAPLIGCSVVVMPDEQFASFSDNSLAVQRLKAWSGNDGMTIRDMYTAAKSNIKMPGRIWILCNDEPDKLRDNSGALASRFVIFPFVKSFFGKEDLGLKEAIAREGMGIGLWAMYHYWKLWSMQRPQIVSAGPEAAEIHRDIEESMSPMIAFVRACCKVGDDCEHESILASTLYAVLERYFIANKQERSIFQPRKLPAKLRTLVPGLKTQEISTASGPVLALYGITLRDDLPDHLMYGGAEAGSVVSRGVNRWGRGAEVGEASGTEKARSDGVNKSAREGAGQQPEIPF